MNKVDLSLFNNKWYKPGAGKILIFIWYIINVIFFKSAFNPFSSLKVFLLRLFGAKVGKGVIIKPCVNIKYPWKLKIGDYSWIGENCWIDNLDYVEIGDNCCLSQGSMLLCGNHDYKKSSFDLITGSIILEDGVWIGAKSIVCPKVLCKSHSILAVQSVATNNLESFGIYQGNPAIKVRERKINN